MTTTPPSSLIWNRDSQPTTFKEGTSFSFNATTDITPGTTLWWTATGSGLDASDATPQGSTAVAQDGTVSINGSIIADSALDGQEFLGIKVYLDSARQILAGESDQILVEDNSKPVRVENTIYGFVRGRNWTEAESKSIDLGGKLVTIENADKNRLLLSIYPQLYGGQITQPILLDSYWYIGLSRPAASGQWAWQTGTPSTWFNWGDSQPDPSYNTAQLDVRSGTWYTGDSNVFSLGVYQKDAPSNSPAVGVSAIGPISSTDPRLFLGPTWINDTDNPADYSPFLSYGWEISADNGASWTPLTNADATDSDQYYLPQPSDAGKLLRGTSSFLDGNLYKETVFSDQVRVNLSPTDISASSQAIDENIASGSIIATLASSDATPGETFTFALVSGTGDSDNSAFTIAGDQLKINLSPDYETKSSYSIRIQSTDSGGLTFQKALTLGVNDLPETVISGGSESATSSSGSGGGANPTSTQAAPIETPATATQIPSKPLDQPPTAQTESVLGITPRASVERVTLESPLTVNGVQIAEAVVGTNLRDTVTGTNVGEVIAGGQLKDTLIGNGGPDGFFFETNEFGKGVADVVTDFNRSQGDKILLSTNTFGDIGQVTIQTVKSSKQAKQAGTSTNEFIYEGKKGLLYFNENGSQKGFGEGGIFAALQGAPKLGVTDLTLI